MKKIVLTFLVAGTLLLSSCGIQNHFSFNVVSTPTSLEDTISVEGKFWGLTDLLKDNIENNSKFMIFMSDATKNCKLEITQSPTGFNDTLALKLSCDSSFSKGKLFLDKLKPKK